MTKTLDADKKEFDQWIEDNADKVSETKETWAKAMMQEGVVVDVHIGRWRAKKKINLDDDFGITMSSDEEEDFFNKYIHPGQKNLLPSELIKQLSKIEQQARANLERLSFETVWGRFIPATAFSVWKERNDELRSKYFAIRDQIGRDYDSIVDTVKKEYVSAAIKAFRTKNGNDAEIPDSYIVDFVSRIVSHIPSCNQIVSSFYYDEVYSVIPAPKFMGDKSANTAELVETNKDKSKKIKEVNAIIAKEYMNKKEEMINGFLDSTIKALRQEISKMCSNVMASLDKNGGVLVGRTRMGMRNTIDLVKQMNFYEDQEIDDAIDKIGNVLEWANIEEKENDHVSKIHDTIQEVSRNIEDSIPKMIYRRFVDLEI